MSRNLPPLHRDKKLYVWMLICCGIFFLYTAITARFSPGITFTKSVPFRFFIAVKTKDFKRGDHIIFYRPKDKAFPGGNLIKMILCMPGDMLEEKNRDYYCNGKYMLTAKTISRTGVPLKHFQFKGRIPENCYFVVGDGDIKNAYDSRYFGFVKRQEIKARVIPLW